MNRQTLAVILGTVALLVVGALLMYSTPTQQTVNPAVPPGAKAKVEKAGKKPTTRRLSGGKLVHAEEIAEDRVAAPAGAPNVVMVVLSTQRRDQWTPYGGPDSTTPFLASRAAEGVLMMDALAVGVDPRPADAAIISGRYPHKVGVIEPTDKRNNNPMSAEIVTIAERFQVAGWNTVGLTANHNLNHKAGGSQGFDWYRDSQPFSLMLDQRIDGADLVDKAIERLGKRVDAEKVRPLYLQMAFVDSHKPFKIPPDEFAPFQQGDNPEVAPYRATVKRQDDAIRKLVEGLATAGLTAENTLFIVVADHGEGLDIPEAHRKQHGFTLYQSTVRIPWLMWGKGVPKGAKVEGLASQIDVAPTVVGLAGLQNQTGFDGLDLSAVVTGQAASPRTEAYADTHYSGAHRASVWTATHQCQKDFGSKEIEADEFENACYDRKGDPDFTKPIEDATLSARLEALHSELMSSVGG